MNIYLISQELNDNYDTYDSLVVIAENEESARLTHPYSGGIDWKDEDFNRHKDVWVSFDQINQIKVELIGKAEKSQQKGVVLASFNAG